MKKIHLLCITLSLLLSACQTQHSTLPASKNGNKQVARQHKPWVAKSTDPRYTQSQDGATNGPAPKAFKEPKPAHEPLSRYGNPDSYKVDGHHYQVLRKTSGYREKGLASWYGTKFHKMRTSSGEPYDMYAMTAAHKTLPLPTYLRVKNVKTGQTAIVKVNDRGPFHSDRILDLSYAAAHRLGLFPRGTALVEIETLSGFSREARYYIQAGAFGTQDSARTLRDKLAGFSHAPVLIEKHSGRYIVRTGPFSSKQEAEAMKQKLNAHGVYGSYAMLQ